MSAMLKILSRCVVLYLCHTHTFGFNKSSYHAYFAQL